MGGALSFAVSGGQLDESAQWKGRIAGTAVGVVGGAVAGNIAKDIVSIGGDQRIVLYGSIGVGGLLGYMYLSDALGVASQLTKISAS